MAVESLGRRTSREFAVTGTVVHALAAAGKQSKETTAQSLLYVVDAAVEICQEVCALAGACGLYAEINARSIGRRDSRRLVGAIVCEAECPNPALVDMAVTNLAGRIAVIEQSGRL